MNPFTRWMALPVALFVLTPALAACAKPPPAEPVVQIREVFVPVAKSCVPSNLGDTPDWRVTGDTVKRAPTPEDRYIAAAAGMKERDDRLKAVEPVISKCR